MFCIKCGEELKDGYCPKCKEKREMATLIVSRTGNAFGVVVDLNFEIDGVKYNILPGKTLTIPLVPGEHVFSYSIEVIGKRKVNNKMADGETYLLKLDFFDLIYSKPKFILQEK